MHRLRTRRAPHRLFAGDRSGAAGSDALLLLADVDRVETADAGAESSRAVAAVRLRRKLCRLVDPCTRAALAAR